MKIKKIIDVIIVMLIGVNLTGCKDNIDDFNKELDIFYNYINGNHIYEEDYKMTINQSFYNKTDDDKISYVYYKDDNKFYADEYYGDSLNKKIWYVSKDENEYIKAYKETNSGNVSMKYSLYDEEAASLENKKQKKKFLLTAYNEIIEALNACSDGYGECEIDKKLFKKEYNIEIEIEKEKTKKEIEATIKNGRLTSFEIESIYIGKISEKQEKRTMSLVVEYENQTVDFKLTEDYIKE